MSSQEFSEACEELQKIIIAVIANYHPDVALSVQGRLLISTMDYHGVEDEEKVSYSNN